MTKNVILIDGSSYFFRAFHALPPLNYNGQATGAIYGVANMVKRLIKDENPTHMAVVFDAKGKTFRDEWYPEYKANRPPMPYELSSQFAPLQEILQAMGIPVLIIPGVEADDVIATLADLAVKQGQSVIISTGDKDMAQLVSDKIHLMNTMTQQYLDPAGVKAKFGVMPEQIIDYLSLVGDTSDNIPGVPNCGPKTAVKWLTTYNNLENLLLHKDAITGKIGNNLRASIEQLALAKRLVTLKRDLILEPYDLSIKPAHDESLQLLAQKFNFKNWIQATKPAPTTTTVLNTLEAITSWLKILDTADRLYLALFVDDNTCYGIGLSADECSPVYITYISSMWQALQPYLEKPTLLKIGFDLKTIYLYLQRHTIKLQGIAYDILLEYYLQSSKTVRADFATIVQELFNTEALDPKKPKFSDLTPEAMAQYATHYTKMLHKTHNALYTNLAPPIQNVLHAIEMPLVTVLAEMESAGVLLDVPLLQQQGVKLKQQLSELETTAYNLAGHKFNLNSPKQLQTILYEEQQFPILAKTPKGQPSTAEAVLQTLAKSHELPAVILEYRSLSKLVSTYIDALPLCIDKNTQRIHTSYNQAITTTGRLSSSDPNLQNIPIRTTEGRAIRRAFIAPNKHLLITADYSQIELRIMAHLSQDSALLHAFKHQQDIHLATAAEIFGIPLENVSKEQRRRAKAVNFGLIYGMSAFGLAKQLDVERQEAQQYINNYFARYPGVHNYMETTRCAARNNGYVETLFGRRLYLQEINDRNALRRQAAERAAINAPLQGTAADIIKQAMIALQQYKQITPTFRMIMQVHDELVFEVPIDMVDIARKIIQHHMENTVKIDVPLSASIGIGENWDAAH